MVRLAHSVRFYPVFLAWLAFLAACLAPGARRALAQVPPNPRLAISTGTAATLPGGLAVQDEDVVLCALSSSGEESTSCTWSLLFDGSAAGLDSDVKSLDVLPDGSLVMAVGSDGSIPDLSAIKAKDLALFIPADPTSLPYTAGEWRLFMDGDAVKGSTDGRVWDAVSVLPDGDVLVSVSTGGTLGGVVFDNEDILRCHPTTFSVGGAITGCAYSLFLDSSAIQLTGGGAGGFTSNLYAFELLGADGLLFRAGSSPGLPSHQAARDLLLYTGTFGATPVGTHVFFFDGDAASGGAGLGGESLNAMALLPDGDGDGLLDGLDNCPDDANPGQADGDGDGIGDVCDYCPNRADPTCRCGDGLVDAPSETCDLGDGVNGQPESPCSAGCSVIGACTGSGTSCQDASDCPAGEGCCGNAITETGEQCDDGNVVNGDQCNNACVLKPAGIAVLGCEDLFGPNVVPAFVRNTTFSDARKIPGPFDRWRTAGDFNLGVGQEIDPDSEPVTVIFNQGTSATPAYAATLPAGSFVQKGSPIRPRWQFVDREADVPGALGWHRGVFRLKGNKVNDVLVGKNQSIPFDTTPPVRMRQTIRSGNDCATAIIECDVKAKGRTLRCKSVTFGSPSGAFIDGAAFY